MPAKAPPSNIAVAPLSGTLTGVPGPAAKLVAVAPVQIAVINAAYFSNFMFLWGFCYEVLTRSLLVTGLTPLNSIRWTKSFKIHHEGLVETHNRFGDKIIRIRFLFYNFGPISSSGW